MNKRIQELADRVTTYKWLEGQGTHVEFDKELFAKLIVQECCQALRPMLRDMISRGQGAELIKKHFGVE